MNFSFYRNSRLHIKYLKVQHSVIINFRILFLNFLFTLKRLGGQFDLTLPDPLPAVFPIFFSRRRVKPWFLVTFNIIVSDIFPENFIETYHVVKNILKFLSSVLAIFANFLIFFTFTCCRKLYDISIQQMVSF